MKRQILLVAGEASGDLHAAHLATEIKKLYPDIDITGMGQACMEKCGVRLYVRSDEIAVFGVLEVLKYAGKIRAIFKGLLEKIDSERPDLVVLVDYPGFNLRLARELKKRGIPVIYYISPQVWAWWKGRISTIKQCVSKMLVLFPFEETMYKEHGVPVEFVGHPLVESVKVTASREDIIKSHAEFNGKRMVALMPGSREREIDFIMPVLLAAAKEISAKDKKAHFIIAKAPTLPDSVYERYLRGLDLPHTVIKNESGRFYNYLAASDLALVASGTATLEAAITNTPLLIIYKTAAITAMIARLVIRVPYVGLVNIVAGRKVVPEFLQYDARPGAIAEEALSLLNDDVKRTAMKMDLEEVRSKLGGEGSSKRAARIIVDLLNT